MYYLKFSCKCVFRIYCETFSLSSAPAKAVPIPNLNKNTGRLSFRISFIAFRALRLQRFPSFLRHKQEIGRGLVLYALNSEVALVDPFSCKFEIAISLKLHNLF